MQWTFLVLALLAALAEMHTGTFYLAGVGAAALATAGLGFWLSDEQAVALFVVLCGCLIVFVPQIRRRQARMQNLPDFDVGQPVEILGVTPGDAGLTVRYRGTVWQARMTDGTVPAVGDRAIIAGKTDKLLNLVTSPEARGR